MMFGLGLFKKRVLALGGKEDDKGFYLSTNTAVCGYTGEDDDFMSCSVNVQSTKGFINQYFDCVIKYPSQMEESIIWEEYFIPMGIATREEYDELLKLEETKC